jgi:hypothetical protein
MRRSVAQLSKQLGQTFESSCGAGEVFPTPRPLDAWAIWFTRDRPRPPASGPAGVEADDPGHRPEYRPVAFAPGHCLSSRSSSASKAYKRQTREDPSTLM